LLALVVGVLLPAASVIWFMTEAAGNQADAARQRLSDARRLQLQLLRERINTDWALRIGRLRAIEPAGPGAFHRAATSGDVDVLLFRDAAGAPIYPRMFSDGGAGSLDAAPEWRSAATLELSGRYGAAANAYGAIAASQREPDRIARAAQARVRVLVAAADTEAALRTITRYFSSTPYAGRDRYGRLIAADAQVLALRLVPPSDPRFTALRERLVTLVNDYDSVSMPSSQRLFTMNELRARVGAAIDLPTYAAERLAAEFLEADGDVPRGPTLEASRLPGVWKLAVGSQAVALFHTETVTAMAATLFNARNTPDAASFALMPPGGESSAETITAGALLPGWLIRASTGAAERREEAGGVGAYLWAGSLSVAGLAVGGLLLWQAVRRQVQLNRLKTDLVAAVSHELRTPLTSVQALVEILLENPALDRQQARDYLTMIAGEHARLSRLIEHFLTFARVERNGHGLVFRDVAPASLVTELTRPPGANRFPGLTLEVASDLPSVYGDQDALVTVLLNLLENAYKYTGDDRRVALRLRQHAARIIVEVEDNGIGIDRRNQKRIFRPFYQVDQRLARERGGCGLGLSIVDFIVRAHGGEVTVESAPGAGSVFRVMLPSRVAREVA
jgi:signal transduction histidine kinase